jgi:hypothetical protein
VPGVVRAIIKCINRDGNLASHLGGLISSALASVKQDRLKESLETELIKVRNQYQYAQLSLHRRWRDCVCTANVFVDFNRPDHIAF